MNSKLLNLAILFASCISATSSTVDGKVWLEPTANRTFEHHQWSPTTDFNSPLAAKLERLQVPEALKPYEHVMTRLRAAGIKNAEQALVRLAGTPEDLGVGLVQAIASLPDVSPERIPVLSAGNNRDHPAIKLARELATHKHVLDRIRHLATIYSASGDIQIYGKQYDVVNKVAGEIAGHDTDLPTSLGLLSGFYKVMTQTGGSPVIPVLDAFLSQSISDTSMVHWFWRQLSDSERATLKRAVDKFTAICISFMEGPYINPKVMAKSLEGLKPAFDSLKDSQYGQDLNKSYHDLLDKMHTFDALYTIIRSRFNVPPEIGFRAFMKQFSSLMGRLQGVVATIPGSTVGTVAGVTGTTTGSIPGAVSGTLSGTHVAGSNGLVVDSRGNVVGANGAVTGGHGTSSGVIDTHGNLTSGHVAGATGSTPGPAGTSTGVNVAGAITGAGSQVDHTNAAGHVAGATNIVAGATNGVAGTNSIAGTAGPNPTVGIAGTTSTGSSPTTNGAAGSTTGAAGSTASSGTAGHTDTIIAGTSTNVAGTVAQSVKEARQAAKQEALKKKEFEFSHLKDQFSALKGALSSVVRMADDFEKSLNAYQV